MELLIGNIITVSLGMMYGWVPTILYVLAGVLKRMDNYENTFTYPHPHIVLPWFRWVNVAEDPDDFNFSEIVADALIVVMSLYPLVLLSRDVNLIPFYLTLASIALFVWLFFKVARWWV